MALTPSSPASAAVLTASGLTFGYGTGLLFKDWAGQLLPGVTLVRGGDGRGKSTLLRLLAGAQAAQRGQLAIGSTSLAAAPGGYRAQVFWTEARSDAHDALTPTAYFEAMARQHAGFDSTILAGMTKGLGLEPHLHKQLFMLSTGSKRKVWLAAAFASQATVTFIDEPFAALDGPSMAFVTQCLQKAADGGQRAVVIADYEAPLGVTLAGTIDLGD
jgi:ABC-type multidrug transport system ATPase subunit